MYRRYESPFYAGSHLTGYTLPSNANGDHRASSDHVDRLLTGTDLSPRPATIHFMLQTPVGPCRRSGEHQLLIILHRY